MSDPQARWWRRMGDKKRGFWYEDAQGRRLTSPSALTRIAALKIPPAWTDVRIAPSSRGKLQATGFDTKGRKQYRYHADWVEQQSAAKFRKLVDFVRHLPEFRAATSEHLERSELGREKVLALVSRLITEGCFRIGGERYARENQSFGIATLGVEHVSVSECCLEFSFKGKRGVEQAKVICDEGLAALMGELLRLPGERLFKYPKADGAIAHVSDREVNAYLKEVMGERFSAKDFRTWGGTLLAARILAERGPAPDAKACKKAITECVKEVSRYLGNTPAVARASYIAPVVFSCYERGVTLQDFAPRGKRVLSLKEQGYTAEEYELMRMLSIESEPEGRKVAFWREAERTTA